MRALIYWIFGVVFAFLAAVGATELLRSGLRYFLSPPRDRVTYMVHVRGRDERVEYIVRSLVCAAREQGADGHPVIVLIDEDMDAQTRQICDTLAGELGCVRVCKTHELPQVLAGRA